VSISVNNFPVGGIGLKARRKKFGFGYLLLFLFVGIVFISVSLLLSKSQQINPSWVRISGSISDYTPSLANGHTSYDPIVTYAVKGKKYIVSSSTSSSSIPLKGTPVSVAYNPSNPNQAKVVSSAVQKSLPFIFGVIGLIMTVLGIVLFILSWRRSKDINNLRQSGHKVKGIIIDFRVTAYDGASERSGFNTMQPIYKVIVAANDPVSGNERQYTSDAVKGMATAIYEALRDVYVNPSNPDDYYVDVSELPGLTPERIQALLASVTGDSDAVTASPLQPSGVTGANIVSPAAPIAPASAEVVVSPQQNIAAIPQASNVQAPNNLSTQSDNRHIPDDQSSSNPN
jgi:hypothetical protein